MAWMHGFPVNSKENQERFIDQCQETGNFNIKFPPLAKGLLKPNKITAIYTEFIFGITHTAVDKIIEAPLFVCLVKPDEWILD